MTPDHPRSCRLRSKMNIAHLKLKKARLGNKNKAHTLLVLICMLKRQ